MKEMKLNDGSGIIYSATVEGDAKSMLEGFIVMALMHNTVRFYKIEGDTLHLSWHDLTGYLPLPYTLTLDNAFDFIYNWLIDLDKPKLTGDGEQLGFSATLEDGKPITIKGHFIYYGK